MQIKIFSINSFSSTDAEEEMNKFLRGHRIIEVQQRYDETRGIWTFSVSYLESSIPSKPAIIPQNEKIDYRKILSPNIFDIFTKLREQRKILAREESVPAYAIFTDKELALIAEMPEISNESLAKIEGINKGRVEKYGIRILQGYFNQSRE